MSLPVLPVKYIQETVVACLTVQALCWPS